MKCLIDADMLVYEVGFGSEYKDEEGQHQIRPFDSAIRLLEDKISIIQEETWADEQPTMYLTGDYKLQEKLNRRRKKQKKPPLNFKDNFRIALAKTEEYKGGRKNGKPFHYENLRSYIIGNFETKIAWELEADDLLSIDHKLDPDNTIICSRDKDLRITPGTHYTWPCGKSHGSGPDLVTELGQLSMDGKKFKGDGLKFFYSQLITGDTVDNVPGIPGKGPAAAFKALEGCQDEAELFGATKELYESRIGDSWREYMREQAALLWMIQELDEEGKPVMFKLYDER